MNFFDDVALLSQSVETDSLEHWAGRAYSTLMIMGNIPGAVAPEALDAMKHTLARAPESVSVEGAFQTFVAVEEAERVADDE